MFSHLPDGQFFSLQCPLRVAVLKLDHLGDFLLSLPALQALQDKLGPCEIDLVVGSWNLSMAKRVPGISQIFTFDFFQQQSNMPPTRKEKLLQELVAQLPSYDIAIDFRRFADTRFVLAALQATYKIGYRSFDPEIDASLHQILPSTQNQSGVLTSSNQVHTSLQMLRLVEAIPIRAMKNPSLFPATPKKKSIGVFAFAGSPIREWPSKNFMCFIEAFSQAYPDFCLNLYVSSNRASDFVSFQSVENVKVHSSFSLDQLMEHVTENQLILSNDSFGAHVAYQIGASLVELFSGVAPISEFSACFGPATFLQFPVDCGPCHLPNPEACSYELKCLTGITVDQVMEAVKFHLENETYKETRTLYYFL